MGIPKNCAHLGAAQWLAGRGHVEPYGGRMARLLTVGHGTLAQNDFAALLTTAGVGAVVDVRRFPGSRRNPHFATDAMESWLPSAGVDYRLEKRLGGRRRIDPEQREADPWWQVEAFRAYAAHSRTTEFAEGMADLLESVAGRRTTAVMCSESLWWRCHRRIVSDVAVLLHDVEVLHLSHSGTLSAHPPAEGARVAEDGLRYDVTAE